MRSASGVVVVVLSIATVAWIPAALAAPLEAYDLVGEDPAGDARHFVATGVADPSGTFTPTRLDILAIEMGTEPEVLHVKLNIAALPAGTGGYMYRVGFNVDEKPYHTCWTLQSTGGRPEADQENLVGCSRFTSSTGVGPATRAAGVQAATADGQAFIRWEVPRSAIGSPADGTALTSVFAETWVRGASTCCAGSTVQAQYLWNRADRAPDATGEFFAYSLGGAGGASGPGVAITVDQANRTVGPGSIVQFRLNASAPVSENSTMTFSALDLPSGWQARFPASDVRFTASEPWARGDLRVSVPSDTADGSYAFPAVAALRGTNATAQVNLTITVDASVTPTAPPEDPEPSPAPSPSPPADNSTGNTTVLEGQEAAAIPAAGPVVVAVAVLTAVGLRRSGRC